MYFCSHHPLCVCCSVTVLFLSFCSSKGRVRRTPAGPAGEFKKQSVKYTAQKLHEKGVILEIEGLPSHQYVTLLNTYNIYCVHVQYHQQALYISKMLSTLLTL